MKSKKKRKGGGLQRANGQRDRLIGKAKALGGVGRSDFIASLLHQFDRSGGLTRKQWEFLRRTVEKWESRASESKGSFYVYIVAAGDFVKIGYSRKIASRLATIQTGNPHQCRLIKSWLIGDHEDAARRAESHLHERLSFCRYRGEWFDRPDVETMLERYGDSLLTLDEELRLIYDAQVALGEAVR